MKVKKLMAIMMSLIILSASPFSMCSVFALSDNAIEIDNTSVTSGAGAVVDDEQQRETIETTETTETTTEMTTEETKESVFGQLADGIQTDIQNLSVEDDIMPIAEVPQNENVVYLDPQNGSSLNDGAASTSPVKDLAHAVYLAETLHNSNNGNVTIKLLSPITYESGSGTLSCKSYMIIDATEVDYLVDVSSRTDGAMTTVAILGAKIYGNGNNDGVVAGAKVGAKYKRVNLKLETVEFHNFKTAINSTDDLMDSKISFCTFIDCDMGIKTAGNVTNCIFEGTNRQGTGIGGYIDDAVISYCSFSQLEYGIYIKHEGDYVASTRNGKININSCNFNSNTIGLYASTGFNSSNRKYPISYNIYINDCSFNTNFQAGIRASSAIDANLMGWFPPDCDRYIEISNSRFTNNGNEYVTSGPVIYAGGIVVADADVRIKSIESKGNRYAIAHNNLTGQLSEDRHTHNPCIVIECNENVKIHDKLYTCANTDCIYLTASAKLLGVKPIGVEDASYRAAGTYHNELLQFGGADGYIVQPEDAQQFVSVHYGETYLHYHAGDAAGGYRTPDGITETPCITMVGCTETTYYRNDGVETPLTTIKVNSDLTDISPLKAMEDWLKTQRPGFTFAGWYTTPECKAGTEWNPLDEAMRLQNNSVYAKWIPETYNVTFYMNNGTDEIYHTTTGTVAGFSLPENPKWGNMLFKGWYYDADCTEGQEVDIKNPYIENNELKLYAKWQLAPVLSIAKTVDKSTARPGDTLVYTITVSNAGGVATDVVISDVLPHQLKYISSDIDCDNQNGTLIWTIPMIAQNENKIITLTTQII